MPARRPGGKAASRKARQRYVPRTPQTAAPAQRPSPADPAVEALVEPVSAVEAPPSPAASSAPSRRRAAPVAATSAGSGLSARERADYHYVERDLRNIGVLSLVMAVLLVGAYFLFTALGLVG